MSNSRPDIITGPGGVYRQVHRLQSHKRGPDVVTPPQESPTEAGAQIVLAPVLVVGLICSHLVAMAIAAWIFGSGAAMAAGIVIGLIGGLCIGGERRAAKRLDVKG